MKLCQATRLKPNRVVVQEAKKSVKFYALFRKWEGENVMQVVSWLLLCAVLDLMIFFGFGSVRTSFSSYNPSVDWW